MLAHAFLAVATADERDSSPAPAGLIMLTVNEFRRLFDALCSAPTEPSPACCTGLLGDDDTNTEHADATTSATNHNDHDRRLQY